MTELSLPTEYNMTGRSASAAASRMMWMLSASRRWRCVNVRDLSPPAEMAFTAHQDTRRRDRAFQSELHNCRRCVVGATRPPVRVARDASGHEGADGRRHLERAVALHGVAGAFDHHDLELGEAAAHLVHVFVVDEGRQGAADEQGGHAQE